MSISFGGSSGKSSQTVTPQLAQPSAQEQALIASNARLAQLQSQQMEDQIRQQQAYSSGPQAQMDQQLQQLATQNLLDRLQGNAPVLNPQQQQMLDQAYSSTNQQGMSDLAKFAQQQAAQRGMTTADSPIGAEALDQARRFQSDLQSKRAQSALDLSQTGANFNQSIAQFQAGLQQQALQNRLALNTAAPASYGQQNNLFAQRLAAAPRSMSGNQDQSANQYGLGLGQVGGFLGGVGSAASAYNQFFPSTGSAQPYGRSIPSAWFSS